MNPSDRTPSLEILVENIATEIDSNIQFSTENERVFFIENIISILIESDERDVESNINQFLLEYYDNADELKPILTEGIGEGIGNVLRGIGGGIGSFVRGVGKGIGNVAHGIGSGIGSILHGPGGGRDGRDGSSGRDGRGGDRDRDRSHYNQHAPGVSVIVKQGGQEAALARGGDAGAPAAGAAPGAAPATDNTQPSESSEEKREKKNPETPTGAPVVASTGKNKNLNTAGGHQAGGDIKTMSRGDNIGKFVGGDDNSTDNSDYSDHSVRTDQSVGKQTDNSTGKQQGNANQRMRAGENARVKARLKREARREAVREEVDGNDNNTSFTLIECYSAFLNRKSPYSY